MSGSISELISELKIASDQVDRRGKAFKTEFVVQNLSNQDIIINSWKFNEWDYGKEHKIKLPCNARGLFTSLDSNGNDYIVTRGYDKFFSIDELPFTKWSAIESNTKGPYEVSLKENGCIIFITGLEDGTIVVCSKHSVGVRDDVNKNHAMAGEKFLRKQLGNDDVKLKELAKELYSKNFTAVAEYCDDDFEEHVLEYSKDKAGLYLHGLNKNVVNFETAPMDEVDSFAEKWGFQKIEYFIIENIKQLKKFVEKCAETGCYNNKEIEGFVIRSHLKDSGDPFFFKYKFEEPYLMYRQWREVTKEYINTRHRVFKFNRHKFITNQYLDYVIPLLEQDPQLCEDYSKGFGIVKLRKMFLTEYGMTGMEVLNLGKIKELEEKNSIDYEKVDEDTKFLLVPLSIIGCGKTTTSLVLSALYPDIVGHVQNDDIKGKDKAKLIKQSLELLKTKKCVIVDRNNHQYLHRKQIFEWIDQYKEDYLPYDTNIKVIAVPFFDYDDIDAIFKITSGRVIERGDNHQSIKLSTEGEKKVMGIMSGFLKHFQKLDRSKLPDSQFDEVIPGLTVSNDVKSSLLNAKTIVQWLHENYPVLISNVPSEKEFEDSFSTALNYKPTVVKIKAPSGQNKKPNGLVKSNVIPAKKKIQKIVYFGLKIDDNASVESLVSKYLISNENINFQDVQKGFIPEFHVTLCHTGSIKKLQNGEATYEKFLNIYDEKIGKNTLEVKKGAGVLLPNKTFVKPTKIIWNEHIVTMLVEIPDKDLQSLNLCPHVTISLLDEETQPFYSNALAESFVYKTTDEGQIFCIDVNDGELLEGQLCAYF